MFVDRKIVRKYFLEIHYWRFAWKFNVGWNFALGQNSMLNRMGVLSGATGASKTSISGVCCAKLIFTLITGKLTTVDEREIEKCATKYLVVFVELFCGVRRSSGVHRRSGERVGSMWASERAKLAQNLTARTLRVPNGSEGSGEMTIVHDRLIPLYWCAAHPCWL